MSTDTKTAGLLLLVCRRHLHFIPASFSAFPVGSAWASRAFAATHARLVFLEGLLLRAVAIDEGEEWEIGGRLVILSVCIVTIAAHKVV